MVGYDVPYSKPAKLDDPQNDRHFSGVRLSMLSWETSISVICPLSVMAVG